MIRFPLLVVGSVSGMLDEELPRAALSDGAVITPYENGPLLVRGTFRIVDAEGNEIDGGRRTIALCRCGSSARKPFCDGSHNAVGFCAIGGDERATEAPPQRPRAVRGNGDPLAAVQNTSEEDALTDSEPRAD